jgi:hypothetical protein
MNEDSHDLFSALWGDRPALQENWIKYKLFPPPNPQVISATSSAHTLLKDIQLVLNPIVGQHIWQHEEFELTVQADGTLEGCTKFGDNIEDEWFIVHLLLVATQTFPGLVGHVEDNDGQFLCIESALHLPSWMTPQNSSNRIFLYNGTVHVISPDTCRNLDDDQSIGVDFIRSTKVNTAAPSNMCRAILFRTNVFPETARNSIHHAHCFLPYRVASLLRLRPKLVAAATRAFYYRTAEETAMCTQMTTFPPLESSRVAVSVPFTRCLYAQLSQQEFPPPPQFQSWYTSSSSTNTSSSTNNTNNTNSGTTNTTNTTSNNVAHARATDIGMRLTCGFEMLCAKHPDINNITESNSIAKRFELFCRQLTTQNFFVSVTNEKERLIKMSVARDFFNRQEEITQKSNESQEIAGAVDAPLSAPSFPTCLAEIAVPEGNMDWLRNSSELDAKMANYSTTPNGTGTSTAQKDMQSAHEMASRLAEEMKEFVNATSDYSGVESSAPASAPTTATTAATNSSDTSFALDLDKLLGILGNDVTGFYV